MRLDKFLKETGFGSRKDTKLIIKQKRVYVNDVLAKSDSLNVDEEKDIIVVDGKEVKYIKYVYIMLNKPKNVVSATIDNVHKTVIDLINDYKYLDLFPVGRLDIDTEGLLLITNDGVLSHNLLSPKKHVDKKYYLLTDAPLTNEDIASLEKGVLLDNELTLPSIVERGNEPNSYYLTIREGKFHQVKRMIEAVSKKVIYLKRVSFGPLVLDETLPLGSYRNLNEEEILSLLEHK